MVRDGDVASASNYLAVRGVLRAVGKRVQVYVASEDVGQVDPELLKDLVATFDDRIFPVAAASVGLARDVDGDGRFTVLLSSWLSRLGNGRNAVDGFVRVSDLDLAFSAPFGNRCDMMYLSTSLKPGPHLRTVLAHEYMHAVVFSGKFRETDGVRPVVLEEEGWLDEALAHLAEDQQGFSRSNIDYRISAFLSQPERYQLVVEDYYAANLFRSHGNRGSTYLFLRWCVDQYGPELMPALIHSRLRGTANLEDVTGCSFAELFRRWSVALFMSGLDPASQPDQRGTYRSMDVRNPLEDWELAGPRASYVAAGGRADCWSAAGTSSHFAVVRGSSTAAVEVTVSGPRSAELQVTAVPLPAGMAQTRTLGKSHRRGGRRSPSEGHDSRTEQRARTPDRAGVGAADTSGRFPCARVPSRAARHAGHCLQLRNLGPGGERGTPLEGNPLEGCSSRNGPADRQARRHRRQRSPRGRLGRDRQPRSRERDQPPSADRRQRPLERFSPMRPPASRRA